MAAFVTHVPEQRAVRLAESMPAALSLDIVGLCDIHRDHASAVPGQDARRLGVGWVRLEVERNSRPASATCLMALSLPAPSIAWKMNSTDHRFWANSNWVRS